MIHLETVKYHIMKFQFETEMSSLLTIYTVIAYGVAGYGAAGYGAAGYSVGYNVRYVNMIY